MNKLLFSVVASLLLVTANAQIDAHTHSNACVNAEKVNPGVDANHPLAIELLKNEKQIKTNGFSQEKTNCDVIIPVVFHIVDQNPAKVTDGQIESAMVILNEDFNKLNAEIGSLDPDFEAFASDVGIEFKLALLDPFGNTTDGIDRVVSDGICNNTSGGGDVSVNCPVKVIAPAWDTDMYLNIWIVNDPYGGTTDATVYSGWAFRAESVPLLSEGEDGIVYNHRFLGTEGSSDAIDFLGDIKRTLTHEVGHYLNLRHTFTDYCSETGNDDFVSDTPKVKYNNCGVSHGSGCCPYTGADPIFWKSCDGVTTVNYENYMDYSRCPGMFTIGQKVRIMAALESSVRSNLITIENLEATGVCTSVAGVADNGIKSHLEIYPNPTSNSIRVKTTVNLSNQNYQIIDINGKVVLNGALDSNQSQININILPAGVYVINIVNFNLIKWFVVKQ